MNSIRKKQMGSVLAVFSFVFLALASNPSKKTFKNVDNWLPPDYSPAKGVLLIQKTSYSKQQKKIEDYTEQKYDGKYEFVDLKTIRDREGKYADTKTYRFAMVITSHTGHISKQDGASTTGGLNYSAFDYFFYDRQADKEYEPTQRASSYISMTYKAIINTINKKFE